MKLLQIWTASQSSYAMSEIEEKICQEHFDLSKFGEIPGNSGNSGNILQCLFKIDTLFFRSNDFAENLSAPSPEVS